MTHDPVNESWVWRQFPVLRARRCATEGCGGWANGTGRCPPCCKREATPEYRRQARLARHRLRRARRAVGA